MFVPDLCLPNLRSTSRWSKETLGSRTSMHGRMGFGSFLLPCVPLCFLSSFVCFCHSCPPFVCHSFRGLVPSCFLVPLSPTLPYLSLSARTCLTLSQICSMIKSLTLDWERSFPSFCCASSWCIPQEIVAVTGIPAPGRSGSISSHLAKRIWGRTWGKGKGHGRDMQKGHGDGEDKQKDMLNPNCAPSPEGICIVEGHYDNTITIRHMRCMACPQCSSSTIAIKMIPLSW
jgi:hypothetical protein